MSIEEIQKLIDNKFEPNNVEWALNVEKVLNDYKLLNYDTRVALNIVINQPLNWHECFPEKSNLLVAKLKDILALKSNNKIKESKVKL